MGVGRSNGQATTEQQVDFFCERLRAVAAGAGRSRAVARSREEAELDDEALGQILKEIEDRIVAAQERPSLLA
jgi:hypothetical protein